MLSSVTGFFFGASATEADSITPVDLKTKDNNEGWVIVDVNDESKSPQQPQQPPLCVATSEGDQHMSDVTEGDSSCPSETETDFSNSHPTSSPESLSPGSQAHFKYRTKGDSGESWIITPPPCFSFSRRRNSTVSDHPLENLLIEHPSMSVYDSNICDSTVSEISMHSVSSESEEEEPVASRTRQQSQQEQPQQVVPRHRQPQLVTPSAGVNIQVQAVKAIRQQQRRNTKKYNKCSLERSNKCRDFQATGKKQRQRNRNLCKSGALNARYGQR
ncbi:hypothetical protein SNE40_008217 [Patella caerulea]|uniref:Tumor protein p53-inducible nuclear protein 1 n=1 Tax=Patella caerulea TaxID=87958 RepID=A0AAN8PYK8_PATCE